MVNILPKSSQARKKPPPLVIPLPVVIPASVLTLHSYFLLFSSALFM